MTRRSLATEEDQNRHDDEPAADAEQAGDQAGERADQQINNQDIHGAFGVLNRYATACITAKA